MENHINASFFRPIIARVSSNKGVIPIDDVVSGRLALTIIASSLKKDDINYEKMRDNAVSIFKPTSKLMPSKLDKISEQTEAELDAIAVKVGKEPLLMALIEILHATNFISSIPTERNLWFNHMLAIMLGEVSDLNPQAYSKGSVMYQGNLVPYETTGLFQQTVANWNNGISRFNNSVQGSSLNKSGYMAVIAKYFAIQPDQFIQPYGSFGPNYMPIYQAVPILGQLLGLQQALGSQFQFKDGWWVPRNLQLASKPNWRYLKVTYPLLLQNYYGGRQALLTMMHVNGNSFLHLDMLGNHLLRVPQDVRTFAGLTCNAKLKAVISYIMDEYDITARISTSIQGDIYTDPLEKNEVKKAPVSPWSFVKSKIGSYAGGMNISSTKGDNKMLRKEVNLGLNVRKIYPSEQKFKEEYVFSPYGMRKRNGKVKMHKGIDIKFNKEPVKALFDGKVTVVPHSISGGYGNLIKIKHSEPYSDYETWYAHLKSFLVKNGSMVKKGQIVAISDSTGDSDGDHLHLEVRKNGKAIDPLSKDNPFEIKYVKDLKL